MRSDFEIICLSQKELHLAIDFLKPYEHTCVSLMARLLNQDSIKTQTVYIVKEKKLLLNISNILGVFLISNNGILLHHLLPCDIKKPLTLLLKKKNLYSLGGTEQSSKIFLSALPKKPLVINDYHLMIYNNKMNTIMPSTINKDFFEIRNCDYTDEDRLYDLQLKYQIEEVLPPGKTITEKVCRSILKDRLQSHVVFALCDAKSKKALAMAGTNAKGLHYMQLGGIFTDLQYRNQGFAQTVIQELIRNLNSNVSLFVRVGNSAAIKAYSNIGFRRVDSYQIAYM